MRRPAGIGWRHVASGAALWCAVAGAATPLPAAPPAASCCASREQAYDQFRQGVGSLVAGRDLPQANKLLCQAACCVPKPDAELRMTVRGVLTVPYLPFFYVGLSYLRLGEECRALASFNLSACEREVASVEARRRELETHRAALRRQRPRTDPVFGEGLEAYRAGRWDEAAAKMAEALAAWDEDGEPARLYGRWQTDRPYLPRYFLARALFELGCVRESVALLRCSRLGRCELAGARDEHPDALLAEAERRLAGGGEEPPGCGRWQSLAAPRDGCCACRQCGAP